ncbi:putative ABC transporter ATP-binding protein [Sporotomaculum syntrophicum]|uniref:ABC transporter ATP-binding protein n=1 Tax=Sporotomaculum syntrophicum TaxID=182264 RepID=A0A9D3AXR3_9FIRM|nr:ABC transporter ATP-binding protein [Sporotomaculum syntrophicum]KAF1085302.1 putative ABC transporter ATP-binding protein [Sporotomaculum syntrophicum]
MHLLEVIDASFSYKSAKIFEHISISIGPGEVHCIIGPNGCGKTTLLDCILGILKFNAGEIKLMGRNINQYRIWEIANQMAYVPQSHAKTFPYTVLDIVLMGRASHTGMFSSPDMEDRAIAEDALAMVGLSRYKDRPYTQLSGGEGQLVMIARALAQQTPLIIMDEPTAHLDFKHELIVLETIVRLVRDTGLSVVMATHFPNHAFYFANHGINTFVALMSNHSFMAKGHPDNILTEENLQSVYNIYAKVVTQHIDEIGELKQIIPVGTLANNFQGGQTV